MYIGTKLWLSSKIFGHRWPKWYSKWPWKINYVFSWLQSEEKPCAVTFGAFYVWSGTVAKLAGIMISNCSERAKVWSYQVFVDIVNPQWTAAVALWVVKKYVNHLFWQNGRGMFSCRSVSSKRARFPSQVKFPKFCNTKKKLLCASHRKYCDQNEKLN